MSAISAWHADHEQFRTLLAELRGELDVFHRGGRPDYERMSQVVGSLREYGDAVHHPREDVAFQRLALRCPELGTIPEDRRVGRATRDGRPFVLAYPRHPIARRFSEWAARLTRART